MANMDVNIVKVLCSIFQNEETDESKCFDIVVKFKNEAQFDMFDGDGFDMIQEALSNAIAKKHGKEWSIDDIVEVDRNGKEDDIVDLDLTELP